MPSFFLILYSLLFLFLALKNLKWAVYLVCFTLPAYLIRFQIGPLPMTALEVEVIILFVVWIFKSRHSEARRADGISRSHRFARDDKKNKLLCYSITLLLITSFISIFISPNLRTAAGVWRAYFLEPLLFFIVFISVIKKEDLKKVFLFLCFNAFLLSCFALYQKFTGAFISNPFWADEATRRVTSVFPYPNALALYLAPIVVAALGVLVMKAELVVCNKKTLITYYLLLITTVAAIAAIYFTKSKGALLALLAGIVFYAIFFQGRRKFFIGILLIAFFSFFLFFLFSPNNLANTLKGASTVEGGDSVSTRIDMWRETWAMLKTRPILVAGLAGYQSAVAPFHQKNYIEVYLYPHNIFLNFWSEIGLFGLLAFLGIIIWFYKTGIRNREYGISIILMAGMTALIIHGLVDVPYFKNDLSVLFWILVASAYVILSDSEGSRQITV